MNCRLRIRVLIALCLVAALSSGQSTWNPATTLPGVDPSFGAGVAVLGDVDGDRFNDYAVASATGLSIHSGATTNLILAIGDTTCSTYGCFVESAGDPDGDGVADLAVGRSNAALTVYSGADGSVLAVHVGATSFARVDDVDGDGHGDYLVGFGYHSGNAGRATLVSGATGAAILAWSGTAVERLGTAVANLGDVDGDGMPDFALGRPFASLAGAVDVVSGATAATIRTLVAPSANRLGHDLADAGDLDGDGVHEVLAAGLDRGFVFSGATGVVIFTLATNYGAFEQQPRVATADVDLDGRRDFLIGSSITPLVQIFSGDSGALMGMIGSPVPGPHFATTRVDVATGDLNGDGFDEVLLGVPSAPALGGGRACIFTAPMPLVPNVGPVLSSNQVWSTPGSTAGSGFGSALSALRGDVDNDGVNDYAVAAFHAAGTTAPEITFFSGATAAPIRSFAGALGEPLGHRMVGLGDVDSDGIPDLAVTVPNLAQQPGIASRVEIRSGATGSALLTLNSTVWPMAVAGPGDLDGDGAGDLVVSYIGAPVTAYSSTGAVIWSIAGAFPLASGLATVGDVDGDGVADVAIGLQNMAPNGFIMIVSGAGGVPLTFISGPAGTSTTIGSTLESVPDLDGDGLADVAAPAVQQGDRAIRIYSSASGALIRTLTDPVDLHGFGRSMTALDDLDGDGVAEIAVAGTGCAVVFSGASGAILTRVLPPNTGDLFGLDMIAAGDFDADGKRDLIVGAVDPASTTDAGRVDVFALSPTATGAADVAPPSGILAPAAVGTVGTGAGGPYAPLHVNRESGGVDRVVEIDLGEAIVFEMRQPPLLVTSMRFAVFGRIGVPPAAEQLFVPTVGTMLFLPAPILPGIPGLFTLADSFNWPGAGFLPSNRGHWEFVVPGIGFPVTFTLYALCDVDDLGGIRVSNGLVVRID